MVPAETIERPPPGLGRGLWEARPAGVFVLAGLLVVAALAWAYVVHARGQAPGGSSRGSRRRGRVP